MGKTVSGEINEVLFELHVKLGFLEKHDTNFNVDIDDNFHQNPVNGFG
jgi:hypothetical protein